MDKEFIIVAFGLFWRKENSLALLAMYPVWGGLKLLHPGSFGVDRWMCPLHTVWSVAIVISWLYCTIIFNLSIKDYVFILYKDKWSSHTRGERRWFFVCRFWVLALYICGGTGRGARWSCYGLLHISWNNSFPCDHSVTLMSLGLAHRRNTICRSFFKTLDTLWLWSSPFKEGSQIRNVRESYHRYTCSIMNAYTSQIEGLNIPEYYW